MPSIIEAPEFLELEHLDTQPSTTAQPQVHGARRGFWQTLAQLVRRPHVNGDLHMSHHDQMARAQMETATEALARNYPSIYILATCGV